MFQYKSQVKIGQKCRNFALVSKILSDEIFYPSKILSDKILSDKVSIRGFWQRGQRAFAEVRIFSPFLITKRKRNVLMVNNTQPFSLNVIVVNGLNMTRSFPLCSRHTVVMEERQTRCISVLAQKLSTKKETSYRDMDCS